MDVLLVLIFVVVFLCSFFILSKPKGLPPGPLTLPLVGSYLFLKQLRKKPPHLAFHDAAKQYGDIYSFRIGSQLTVVLNSYDAIHQALVKQSDVFSDRPNHLPSIDKAVKRGIAMRSYDHTWKALRRFTLQTLRDFGVGKTTLEEKIAVEVDAASKVLESSAGEPVEIAPVLQKVVGNVIYGIVFGKRFDFDDPDIDMLQRLTSIAVSGEGATGVANFLPGWLAKIFARRSYEEFLTKRQNFYRIKEYILTLIKHHEESYDEDSIRDFVDLYIKVKRDSKEETVEVFTEECILQVIIELFVAGSETTFNTLDWAFLFMAEYPDVQAKCFKQIEETVGDKCIEYVDRAKLPFIDATISEIQRLANVAPITVMHSASQETTLLGYKIPKRTILLPSLYSANMDPKHWDEPDKFNPQRFLDANGKYTKNEALVPFSAGPRICLGEPLAKMELFLVFANLLQRFTFEREDANVKHSMKLKPNQATSAPLPYKLRIKGRLV